jgi:hypothetical protein
MYFHRLCVVSYAVKIYTLVKELVLEMTHSHVASFLFFNLSILFVLLESHDSFQRFWNSRIRFFHWSNIKNIHTTGASVSNYNITFLARIGFNLSLNLIERRYHWEIKGTYMQ